MRELIFSNETSIPLASPSGTVRYRAEAATAGTKSRDKSLVSLMHELRRSDRQESLVWLALALSACALVVVSLGYVLPHIH